MTRTWIIAALAAGLTPLSVGGQTPQPRAAPRAQSRVFSFNANRARIGVLVSTVANPETDRYGARLDGVTPGGPADRAGLKTGDVITKFDGTSLAAAASEDRDESGPGDRLVELVGRVDPGDTVQVEYRRDGTTKTVSLVTEEQSGWVLSGRGPEIPQFEMPRLPMALTIPPDGNGFSFCMGDAWCDLDLVTLNPDLGEYFGTQDGLLVVKAPDDSALPLKGGDVILSIGGRKPTSPAHAMRILRSYEAGESVTIEIQRKQHRTTLTWKVPDAQSHWKRVAPHGEQSLWRGQTDAERVLRAALERVETSGELMRERVQRAQQQLRELELRRRAQARSGESIAT
jgi:PDZ domain